jgi:hypothetical protein
MYRRIARGGVIPGRQTSVNACKLAENEATCELANRSPCAPGRDDSPERQTCSRKVRKKEYSLTGAGPAGRAPAEARKPPKAPLARTREWSRGKQCSLRGQRATYRRFACRLQQPSSLACDSRTSCPSSRLDGGVAQGSGQLVGHRRHLAPCVALDGPGRWGVLDASTPRWPASQPSDAHEQIRSCGIRSLRPPEGERPGAGWAAPRSLATRMTCGPSAPRYRRRDPCA